MDLQETFTQLQKLGNGIHYCGWFLGYIEVTQKRDSFEVMWCSGKHTHNAYLGRAVSVDFFEHKVSNVFESALTMHPVNGDTSEHVKFMQRKVYKAFKRLAK